MGDKAWQLIQSSDTKGKQQERDWDSFLGMAKENAWTEDIEDMGKVWKAKKERQ